MTTKYLLSVKQKLILLITLVPAAVAMSGCAGILFGGAATGAAVATDQRTTGTVIEDQAIELKARELIWSDKELNKQSHVSITSYNQIVLITGQTPTEEFRKRVVSLVSSVEKVRHVYDELTIAAPNSLGTRSSDTLLTAKVKTKLLSHENIDGTKVKVVTENGIVYLMGLLQPEQGQLAAEATSQVGGVQKVVKLFESSS